MGDMFDERNPGSPPPEEFGEQTISSTRYYLERLRYLNQAGQGNDSPLVQEVLAEIDALPAEQTERLRSLLAMKKPIVDAAVRVTQEMDPTEDPDRFRARFLEYSEKLLKKRDGKV